MREAYKLARESLKNRAERAKRNYDMHVKPNRYHEGDWVFYYCPRRYTGRSSKWQRLYSGPFLITKVIGPVTVRLQATRRARPFLSHIDKLKLCLGPTPSGWLETVESQEPNLEPSETTAEERVNTPKATRRAIEEPLELRAED